MSDTIDLRRAALSIAKMVDEYTQRGWNEEGLTNFALIVEKRLKRFRVSIIPPEACSPQAPSSLSTDTGEKA